MAFSRGARSEDHAAPTLALILIGAAGFGALLTVETARLIAALAKTARKARDAILDSVPEKDLGEPPVTRGEHNPTGALGFDSLLATRRSQHYAQAVSTLGTARSELFVLMRMGQGDLAAGDWDRGLSEAERLGDETVAA